MTKNRGLAKTPYMAAQRHFWEMIRKGDRASGCWLWPFGTNGRSGYGAISAGVFGGAGIPLLVHRAAYAAANPDAPEPEVVRHRCDVRTCFNPAHLEPGTHLDNARDTTERSRRPIGQHHPHAKLTAAQVAEMRRLRASGVLLADLAEQFGVTVSNACRVCNGRTWQQAGDVQ